MRSAPTSALTFSLDGYPERLATGVPYRGSAPGTVQPRIGGAGLCSRDLAADRPQEGGYLARDRGRSDRQLLAGGAQPAIAGAQPDLAFPGDIADAFGQPFELVLSVSPTLAG